MHCTKLTKFHCAVVDCPTQLISDICHQTNPKDIAGQSANCTADNLQECSITTTTSSLGRNHYKGNQPEIKKGFGFVWFSKFVVKLLWFWFAFELKAMLVCKRGSGPTKSSSAPIKNLTHFAMQQFTAALQNNSLLIVVAVDCVGRGTLLHCKKSSALQFKWSCLHEKQCSHCTLHISL